MENDTGLILLIVGYTSGPTYLGGKSSKKKRNKTRAKRK
jgi:hypothetical protein